MNFPKFQKSLLAIAILTFITLISCNKEKITPDENQIVAAKQPESAVSKELTTRGAGPSVNGQCALRLDYMNGRVQHFAFHASKDANGVVTGSFESKSPGQDGRVHGRIDCLNILPDGKTAIVSGEVTKVIGAGFIDGFGVTKGMPVWFKIQDNGEGSATKDGFTDFQFISPPLIFCGDDVPLEFLPLYPILNGNVQVKP